MPVTLPVVVPRDLSIDSRAEMIPRRNPITTRTTRTPIETQTFSHRDALMSGAAMSGAYAAGRCAIVQISLFTRRGMGSSAYPGQFPSRAQVDVRMEDASTLIA